jgi:hypothetical protein
MNRYSNLLKLSTSVFLILLFVVNILTINNELYAETTAAESNKNLTNTEASIVQQQQQQTENSKPMIFVKAFCQAAQTDVPGEFIAAGFTPNSDILVEANQNNSTGKLSSEPVTVLLSKSTDSVGNVTGEFVLNTHIQQPTSYRDYFLHIYSVNNPQESASASLNLC